MPPITLLIKPSSSACNMVCDYCFYNDIAANRACAFKGMMTIETLELLVKEAFAFADYVCGFAFQGGEPTLVGLDFYKKLIEFQTKYNKKGIRVQNSIQTNGYRLNEDWAKFFVDNNFLVGLSIDGPSDLHDQNRRGKDGKGSHRHIMKSLEYFNKYKVEYNVLSVVTGQSARRIEDTYNYFKNLGFDYLQFIPCLEPLKSERGQVSYHLSVEDYEDFLIKTFDLWYEDFLGGKLISVRHLDNWLSIGLGYPPEACNMRGICSIQFIIEATGEVYPCDFYVLDEWLLGKIGQDGFMDIVNSKRAREFIEESIPIPSQCKQCRYFNLCRNGCKRERLIDENGDNRLFYCQAVKGFFSKREKEFLKAINLIKGMRRR